jgi:hypothetical protein
MADILKSSGSAMMKFLFANLLFGLQPIVNRIAGSASSLQKKFIGTLTDLCSFPFIHRASLDGIRKHKQLRLSAKRDFGVAIDLVTADAWGYAELSRVL